MRKLFSAVACVVLLCGSLLFAQAPDTTSKASGNEVTGLKLPPSSEVKYDEGFVTITAETKGTVKWLVLSTSAKVKFRVHPTVPNEITIAVPPFESAITVFAIAVVDGKQTDFARTDIIVKGGGPAPGPGPGPAPDPNAGAPFHLNIIEDPAKRNTGIRSIVDNPELREQLKTKQVQMRVFSTSDTKSIKELNFEKAYQKYGAPVMIFTDKKGNALIVETLPADKDALLRRIGPTVGGG